MSILIPDGVDYQKEKLFPKLGAVANEVERLGSPDPNFGPRAEAIYQIIELLVNDGRLDRKVLSGDVCCLDVGGSAPEAAVFLALGSGSITLTEGFKREPSVIVSEPRLKFLGLRVPEALERAEPGRFDYITMFNALNPLLLSRQGRLELIRSLDRVLKPGGHFTITGDGVGVGWSEIKSLQGQIAIGKASDSLTLTFPTNGREPMWGLGWVMRSILVENVVGFDYGDYGKEPSDDYLDAMILTAVKIDRTQSN